MKGKAADARTDHAAADDIKKIMAAEIDAGVGDKDGDKVIIELPFPVERRKNHGAGKSRRGMT